MTYLTACGNDLGFEKFFQDISQFVKKRENLLVCLSTSGNSKNILNVLKEANKLGIFTISLGNKGAVKRFSKIFDYSFFKYSFNSRRTHVYFHYILNEVEKRLRS